MLEEKTTKIHLKIVIILIIFSQPTAIVKKLNKIQDHLLRKHDPDLWIHMKELNIVPQVYGL
jgi:hypothetical protein